MNKNQYVEKYGEEEGARLYKEQLHEYYLKTREKRLAYQKKWDTANREYKRKYLKEHARTNIAMFAYCIKDEVEQIENYQLAKADNFDGWCVHHRLETHNEAGERLEKDVSRDSLIEKNLYWQRPAKELIFMTASDHMSLHKAKKGGE